MIPETQPPAFFYVVCAGAFGLIVYIAGYLHGRDRK